MSDFNFLAAIGSSDSALEVSLINSGSFVNPSDDPVFGSLDDFFIESSSSSSVPNAVSEVSSGFDLLGTIDTVTGLAGVGLSIFQGISAVQIAKAEQELQEDIAKAQIAMQKARTEKEIEFLEAKILAAEQQLDFQRRLANAQLTTEEARQLTAQLEEQFKQEILNIQINSLSPPDISKELDEKISRIEEAQGVELTSEAREQIKQELVSIKLPSTSLTVENGKIVEKAKDNKILFLGAAALVTVLILGGK